VKIFDFYIDDVAFACATGFLAGVAAANFAVSLIVVGFAAAMLGGVIVFLVPRRGLWKFAGVVFVCTVAGFCYFHVFENIAAVRTNIVFNKKISFSAVVANEPKISASGKYLIVAADLCAPYAGSVTILAPANSEVFYGDVISMAAKIMPADVAGDSPFVIPPAITVEAHDHGFWLMAALLDFKDAMVRSINGSLSADAAGFLAAVAFSAKEFLTGDVAAAMMASGTSFLATLYGMKISLLVFFVSNLLLGYVDRRIIFGIAVVVAFGFALAAGAPVSAVRAAIMAVVALWARETGGVLLRRNALAFTAVGLMLWNPALVTDIGFLASFGSVAGILYLSPALWNAFHWTKKGILNWRENIVMNLAAQLAIIPLVADAAGGFPLISLISGAVLIVFLPFTVFGGWATGLVGLLMRPAAFVIAPFMSAVAGISISLIRFFASFPFAVAIPWNAWTIPLYYGCLIVFAAIFSKKKSNDIFAAAVSQAEDFTDKEWMPAKVGDETARMDD